MKAKKNSDKKIRKKIIKNKKLMILLILVAGTLFLVSTYAWFTTNLNVRIRTFTMKVDNNSGLTISLDGVNFDTFLEISYDTLIKNLGQLYPGHTSQWVEDGLVPVSSNGITNHNNYYFNMFYSSGVKYRNLDKKDGLVITYLDSESESRAFNRYLAFDVFFKNDSDSPIPDNLYLDNISEISINGGASEEMVGLFNSLRIGIVKVGTVSKTSNANVVQNISCNNDCYSIIYEPRSTEHTDLSIERAVKYGINLQNGNYFDTYAYKQAGGPIIVDTTVSGSPYMDMNYFEKQETVTEEIYSSPLFSIPDGITKARIYVWIEGQDIDSLETDSKGAYLTLSLGFYKDTQGYNQ